MISLDRQTSEEGEDNPEQVNKLEIGEIHLRESLSIIPQLPFKISGKIRQNLDPLGKYTDYQIWSALKDIPLKFLDIVELFKSLIDGLETKISSSCSLLSTGQKQLICLGRAILKKSMILVLDEATSNFDDETETFIQNKIKSKFQDFTLISIAHRLLTIAEYDEVIVLEKGQIIEQGTPYDLVSKNQGIFKKMVQHTGAKK